MFDTKIFTNINHLNMNWNNASDSFIKISLRMCTRARLRSHTLTKLWVMMWTVSAISVLRINRIGTEKNQKSNGRKKERKKWRWTMINSIQSLAPIASNTSEFTWITCDGVCFNLFIRCFFFWSEVESRDQHCLRGISIQQQQKAARVDCGWRYIEI